MSKAQKYNEKKLSFSSLHPTALALVAKVLDYGRYKYAQFNYCAGGLAFEDFHDAYMRHYTKYMSGEEIDPENKMPHIALMAANMFMALANYAEGHYNGKQVNIFKVLELDDEVIARMKSEHNQNFKEKK